MHIAPAHPLEQERLQALHDLQILDTDAEQAYDDIVALACAVVDTPIALVSLVDSDRQWFKARRGIEAQQTSRDVSFCAHAIVHQQRVMVVEDAALDERFRDNPLVTGSPHIRFYAGYALKAPDSRTPVGTLCVISREPRRLTSRQLELLSALGRQVERTLALRSAHNALTDNELARAERIREFTSELRSGVEQMAKTAAIGQQAGTPEAARAALSAVHMGAQSLLERLQANLEEG